MKKLILFCIFFIIMLFFQWNAQAYTSVTTYVTSRTSNSSLKNCNNTIFPNEWAWDWTAYWIPVTNSNSAPSSWSNWLCKTHKYYYSSLDSSTYYDKPININWLWTNCNSWDRAIVHPADSSKIRCLKHDDTAPVISDVTNSNSWSKKLATNSFNYSITILDWWQAPINKLTYQYENTGADTFSTSVTKTTPPWSFLWDISKVQDWFRLSDWSREYTFRINKICDSAKNCFTWPRDYKTYVYANSYNYSIKSVTQELSSDNIADGTTKNLVITLKDNYWNAIVPASWINRKVNIKYGYDNTMYLNQFLKTWNSVYTTEANDSNYSNNFWIWTSKTKDFIDESSTDWTYKYWFKFYTPTASSVQIKKSDINAKFDINNIKFNVTGNPWAIWYTPVDNSNISANFRPLYQTKISWEIDENWFIAWNPQKSRLDITPTLGWNVSWVIPLTKKIYFKFWWGATAKYDLSLSWWGINTYENVREDTISNGNFGFVSNDFKTYLQLVNPPAPSTISANLTTHIAYDIDWNHVVYNSDKVWQDTDWNDVVTQEANQVWLKVIWTTYSKAWIQNIVDNQTTVSIWKFDKSSTKLSIIKNAYAFAKNVTWWGWNTIGNITYYWWLSWYSNQRYDYWLTTSDTYIYTNKTILVIGWNLYIKWNIKYSWNWMLWIVVLKDNAWNWWNVYIDPWVTNISANIFAEKSLISYNWTTELDWGTPASTLKNQLHIYWSVFSYNTIWWSAKNTLECPYYVPASNCNTKSKAQKYDLNYLRRYYLKTNSFWNLEPAYGWLSNYNSWDTNYKYPVIIEYNPNIQKNPPPLFSD